MPGNMTNQDGPIPSFENGSLKLSELQQTAKNVLEFVLKSHTYATDYPAVDATFAQTQGSDERALADSSGSENAKDGKVQYNPNYAFSATKPVRQPAQVSKIYIDGKPTTYLVLEPTRSQNLGPGTMTHSQS
ncbi:hypothetical protein FACS1894125_7490 [Actinomycetota bacterium]|nr:hypothetical protein FACS1894125_7490 [Actinomycetota bacterium]